MPRRALPGLALLAGSSLLAGCVAALVPLAAGAAVGRSELARSDRPAAEPPVRVGAAAEGVTQQEAPAATAEGRLIATGLTALPPSNQASIIGPGDPAIALFADYAIEQAARDPALTPRDGALLASPGQLDTDRIACGEKPPAVVIDLDRGREAFDPYAPHRADPRLADALARIRAEGIAVFWSSSLGAPFAGQLRALLAETGLDPAGADTLLTMHSLDQRKQTRRAAVAVTHCPVAILGDERSDFDELYLYLRDPQASLATDMLIGAGWFLADPFPEESSAAH